MMSQSKRDLRQNNLIGHAKQLAQNLNWLSPTLSLSSTGSRDFGRKIESSLTALNKEQGILRLQLRRHDAAVVMSIDHYEEMVRMKALYAALIEQIKDNEISDAANEYDDLFQKITSLESRKAADGLFSLTASDLRQTYQPGKTEIK